MYHDKSPEYTPGLYCHLGPSVSRTYSYHPPQTTTHCTLILLPSHIIDHHGFYSVSWSNTWSKNLAKELCLKPAPRTAQVSLQDLHSYSCNFHTRNLFRPWALDDVMSVCCCGGYLPLHRDVNFVFMMVSVFICLLSTWVITCTALFN